MHLEIDDKNSIGDSDPNDLGQNQGILSQIEESGGIEENDNSKSKELKQKKDNIFEAQISVIQWNDDPKEISNFEKELNDLEFEPNENECNDSIFDRLNDSLIKNREVMKCKFEKRESIKSILQEKKKESESFLKEDSISNNHNISQNINNQNSMDDEKPIFTKGVMSFKGNQESFQKKLEGKLEPAPSFGPELPSEDFFEEKYSESIIEKNDEDSKFVDEESSSVVFLTKQQLNNNLRGSIKNTIVGKIDGNTKELSRIEDVENSHNMNMNSIESIERSKDDSSKEKNHNSNNSISNINSPKFQIDSIIGDSEIKDTRKLISEIRFNKSQENLEFEGNKQDQESGEVDGYLFTEEESKQKIKPQSDSLTDYKKTKEKVCLITCIC